MHIRLCVNVDHVATIREARKGHVPDPVRAARLCEDAGVDGITAHLREDRRHIQDHDIERLMANIRTPFNFEMAGTDEMLAIAERIRPHQVTLVPERRQEVTTEGGLDVTREPQRLEKALRRLHDAKIRTALFIDPVPLMVERSHWLGADAIEIHTGKYCEHPDDERLLRAIQDASAQAKGLGLAVHAGHGLNTGNVGAIAAIAEIEELNIGHSLVSEAVFVGLPAAIRAMRSAMTAGRA
jgi:pyridoxine 5-phosphate synthase